MTEVENSPKVSQATNKKRVADRIKAIEKRHGKEFTEVLADMHDHVFGTTPDEPEEGADDGDESEVPQTAAEKKAQAAQDRKDARAEKQAEDDEDDE
jgi:hypothetical protein